MINKLFSLQKSLRVILLILAAVSVLSLTVYAIADNSRNNKIQRDRDKIREGFETVLEGLEFNGLNESTIELIQKYREVVGEYSNLIITDDAGYVLYHANNGFMPGTDQFIVLADNDSRFSNQAYILDPELNVRYRILLHRTYNGIKLIEYSNMYRDKYDIIRKDDAFPSDTLDKNMYYAYIGSRGWNVYSIQKILFIVITNTAIGIVPQTQLALLLLFCFGSLFLSGYFWTLKNVTTNLLFGAY